MNESITDLFFSALQQRPDVYMVGIAGVPGSGKTTLCRSIIARRPDSVVVPMDGYHLPRSRLNAEVILADGCRERANLILQS